MAPESVVLRGSRSTSASHSRRISLPVVADEGRRRERRHGISQVPYGRRGGILDAAVVFAGRIVEPAHDEARYLLLGVTSDGRHAALVFTRRGDKLRPISCRAMRKREKEAFDAAT